MTLIPPTAVAALHTAHLNDLCERLAAVRRWDDADPRKAALIAEYEAQLGDEMAEAAIIDEPADDQREEMALASEVAGERDGWAIHVSGLVCILSLRHRNGATVDAIALMDGAWTVQLHRPARSALMRVDAGELVSALTAELRSLECLPAMPAQPSPSVIADAFPY